MDAVGPVDVKLVAVTGDSLEGGRDASEPRMLVHPIGRPIIASTNSGLSRWVGFPERSVSFKGRLFLAIVSGLASPLRVSRAAGVGKRAAVRDGPPCLASVAREFVCGSELRLASEAVGDGSNFVGRSRTSSRSRLQPPPLFFGPAPKRSDVVGVAKRPCAARVNRLFVLPLGRLALSPF